MHSFDLNKLVTESEKSDQRWIEFLRVPAMSMGIYQLKVGDADGQLPHTEDESYYIVGGKASFICSGKVITVTAGSVIYVPRLAEHRFFDITEDLKILVFFAPAEGTVKKQVE